MSKSDENSEVCPPGKYVEKSEENPKLCHSDNERFREGVVLRREKLKGEEKEERNPLEREGQ